MPDPIKEEVDYDNMSAEDLAALGDDDDGQVEIEPDQQAHSIDGIDELNAEPDITPAAESETTPDPDIAPEPEPAPAPVPEPEIDYKAKYLENLERQVNAQQPAPAPVPEPERAKPISYQDALASIEITADQQKKIDEYNSYDTDLADRYEKDLRRDGVSENTYNVDQERTVATANSKADAEQDRMTGLANAINKRENLRNWQKTPQQWNDVNKFFKSMLDNDDEVYKMGFDDQMKTLDDRYSAYQAAITGAPPPVPPPVKQPEPAPEHNADKIIDKVEQSDDAPSSLSSITGTTEEGAPGRIKVSNSTSAADIQVLMDRAAASEDPDAIDKLMSSFDVAWTKMGLEISPEYINTADEYELRECKKIVRLEKGLLSSYDNLINYAENRINNAKEPKPYPETWIIHQNIVYNWFNTIQAERNVNKPCVNYIQTTLYAGLLLDGFLVWIKYPL